MSLWDKLEAVPNWVLYILLILSMAYPIFRPLGLPIVVGEPSQDAYRAVEATPEGAFCVFHIAYGAGGKPTLQPAAVAMSHHFFEKNLKVIYFCDNAVDLANIWGIFDEVSPDTRYGKEYGRDYVVLSLTGPFLTQAAVVLSNLLETIPTDARGQSLKGMPMFQGYTETEDIGIVCQLTTSGDISEGWVYQAVSRYERRLVGGWLSMMTSSMIPYYQAGQILGFIDGSKGSADYEVIANKPGEAVKITDILSLSQVVYILFMIIGNVGYFGKKYMGGGK